jgi:hypothetical protein
MRDKLANVSKKDPHTNIIPIKKMTSKFTIFALIAVIIDFTVPFYIGRWLALNKGYEIVRTLPQQAGIYAFIGGAFALMTIISFMLAFSGRTKHFWALVSISSFFVVQFFFGFCSMRWNFFNPNKIIFVDSTCSSNCGPNLSYIPNAINIGVITSFIAFLVFLIYFVIATFVTKPDSKLAKLTSMKFAIFLLLTIAVLFFVALFSFNLLAFFKGTPNSIL